MSQSNLASHLAALDDDLSKTRQYQTLDQPPSASLVPHVDPLLGTQLGTYVLLDKLGQGGMGAVYRATDSATGNQVAVKVLSHAFAGRPEALRRFLKEARLLSQVSNEYVTRLIEVGEDAEHPYLVLEYVAGGNLRRLLEDHGKLDERRALSVMADVARALADAHERGIVHRDVKPENVLLAEAPELAVDQRTRDQRATEQRAEGRPLVKLTDFGLARHVEQTESLNVTQAGAILGTPIYMAPEQCMGRDGIGPPADVYAMGVMLFELLVGRPPFEAADALQLASMHCYEAPPGLQQLDSTLSDGVVRIVEKALAKHPAARQANAAKLLREIEQLLRGELSATELHPALPGHDERQVFKADYTWDLAATPEQLWPFVADTDRLNRAIGMPAVEYTTQVDAERGVRRFGRFRLAGMTIAWEEHPFEWVEGRRVGILREFTKGPFKWFASVVELAPLPGGTRLTHRVRIESRGLLGRIVAKLEAGSKAQRSLDKVYRRIEATLGNARRSTGGFDSVVDPFEKPFALSAGRTRRLEQRLDRLLELGLDAKLVELLGEFLASASVQEVARIRPLALAKRLGREADEMVSACLHAAKEGLLVLLWDILCPGCRSAFEVKDTLRAIANHGKCDACNLDFELDFANSVELIFRVHPEIREADTGTYCIGGPRHSPHVIAQFRLKPQERLELEVSLDPGDYVLRGPQLPTAVPLRAHAANAHTSPEIRLHSGIAGPVVRPLKSGPQSLVVTNDFEHELVVRLERTVSRPDVLSAARAATLPAFRELYPGEVLSPGQLLSVSTVTLLATRLHRAGGLFEGLSDAAAFGLWQRHLLRLTEVVGGRGGVVVRSEGEVVLSVFGDQAAAVSAVFDLWPMLRAETDHGSLGLSAAVHRGPAMVTTWNDRMDYFGRTVGTVCELARGAGVDQLLISSAVSADSTVAELLAERLGAAGVEAHESLALAGIMVLKVPLASSAFDAPPSAT